MCSPFVESSSPTAGRETWLMVLRVSESQSFQEWHREVFWVAFCLPHILAKCLVENRLYAYAYDSAELAVVRKPADKPAVAASLNTNLARIQEWCNNWCMILNPNITKATVVSRSVIANPLHGNLALSGAFIRASPDLDILGVNVNSTLTFVDHVRGMVSHVRGMVSLSVN